MKHCVIRRSHFPAVMDQIIALAEAGYKSRWSCKKAGDLWTATSVSKIAYSLDELQRAVA